MAKIGQYQMACPAICSSSTLYMACGAIARRFQVNQWPADWRKPVSLLRAGADGCPEHDRLKSCVSEQSWSPIVWSNQHSLSRFPLQSNQQAGQLAGSKIETTQSNLGQVLSSSSSC